MIIQIDVNRMEKSGVARGHKFILDEHVYGRLFTRYCEPSKKAMDSENYPSPNRAHLLKKKTPQNDACYVSKLCGMRHKKHKVVCGN